MIKLASAAFIRINGSPNQIGIVSNLVEEEAPKRVPLIIT